MRRWLLLLLASVMLAGCGAVPVWVSLASAGLGFAGAVATLDGDIVVYETDKETGK